MNQPCSDNVKGGDSFRDLSIPQAIEAIRFEILSTMVSAFSIRRRIHDLFDGRKILELPPFLEPQNIELRLEKKLPLNYPNLPPESILFEWRYIS